MARDIELELKPEKQPTQARSIVTVDAILTAAIHILDQGKDEQLTTHTIATKAGVSIGSLYQYFPSKETLFSAVIRHHLVKRAKYIDETLKHAATLSMEEAPRFIVDRMIGEKLIHIKLERVLIKYFCRVGDIIALTQLDQEMMKSIQDYLQKVEANVRPKNLELASFMVFQSLRAAILMGIMQRPDQLPTEEFRQELTQLLLVYLKNG